MTFISKKKIIFFVSLFFVTAFVTVIFSLKYPAKNAKVLGATTNANNRVFTVQELKKYNGVNPNLPIYLALDGNVYDVTVGKDYYKAGGPYHSLAGKDSSSELHLAGGSIIKRKYKIVGKLLTQ